jgi:hypothetical protein
MEANRLPFGRTAGLTTDKRYSSMFVKVCGKDIRVEGRMVRIARLEGDKYQFLDDPKPVTDALRKAGTRIDLFTFLQKLTETSPIYSYPMEWDNLAVLPLTTFDHWWKQQIDNKTRNMVRKAERKGVEVREVTFDDNLVRGICQIYNETPVRQGRRFPHFGITFERAREYAGTFLDSSIFIGAFFEQELIGFAKLTWDEARTQANLMHIISMIQHRDKAPTNALIVQAVRSCTDRGIPNLVYSNFTYGKKQRDSLSHFKENNGFQRVDLPRYYVPLTAVGWAAYRLGLHHRFLDLVPEPVAAKLRTWRKALYAHKYQPEPEA